MTTGQKLRRKLGLKNYPNAKIGRVIGHPFLYFVVFVVFDSSNRHIIIPTSKLKYGILPFRIRTFDRKSMLTQWWYLDDYDRPIDRDVVVIIDLAGRIHRKFNLWAENIESFLRHSPFSLREDFSITDLSRGIKNPHEIDKFKKRKRYGQTGLSLSQALWNDKENFLELEIKIRPTEPGVKTVYTPSGVPSSAPVYTAYLRFTEVDKYLSTKKEFFNVLTRLERKRFISRVLVKCPVRIWINDPSWLFRGSYQNATDLGYSIYDFYRTKIPRQKGINAMKYYNTRETPLFTLSKHAIEIFQKIGVFGDKIQKILELRWEEEKDEYEEDQQESEEEDTENEPSDENEEAEK